jgi:hypothetical protein
VFDPLLTEAENVRRLFSVHGGKGFQKIFQGKIIRKIIEERTNRDRVPLKTGVPLRIFESQVMKDSAVIPVAQMYHMTRER